MRDLVYLGSTPAEEECAQVGQENYTELAKQECKRYIDLIRQVFGQEPEGAELRIKREAHDFGSYYEVVCYFDSDNEQAIDYAFNVENNAPTRWNVTEQSV